MVDYAQYKLSLLLLGPINLIFIMLRYNIIIVKEIVAI